MNITLRDYQNQAVDNVRAALRRGSRAPLLVLPTGGGKTIVFCYIAERASLRGKRVLILVHRQELLRQTSEKLDMFGVDHGLIAAGHSMNAHPVQVASVQTLVRRLDRLPPPDLIVIDEAHHAVAGSWAKILRAFPNSQLLGVTATPMRHDGKGLGVQSGGFFDSLVEGPTVADLISQGYLSQPVVYAPPSGVDLSGVKTRGGDYERGETAHRMDKPTITGCAIDHYLRVCNGMPAIAFCATVEHAAHVAEQFKDAGIPAESLDGTMTDAVRKHRIQALGKGQIKVLTSCEIISEGTDIPIVGAAILLRPTKSTGLFLQQVGRALRPFEGKSHSVILDHVGNCYRHGLPDDVREWSLDGYRGAGSEKNKDNGPQIRQCERCYAVYSMGASCCPQCGHVNRKRKSELKQVEGELQQVTPGMIKKREKPRWGDLGPLLSEAKKMGLPGDLAYRVLMKRKYRKGERV